MSSREQSLREDRLKKLENLRKQGIDPYPVKTSSKRRLIADVLGTPFEGDPEYKPEKETVIAGRIRSLRLHGRLCFADIEDQSGRIQTILRSDEIGDQSFDTFVAGIDEGDFIEVTGRKIYSQTNQKSVTVKEWTLLAKSLRPIPSEHFGLKDVEQRLRKRYLDLIANPETRELFRKKSLFWQNIRQCMLKHDFLEVETPVLEAVPGGAEAEPFTTHHNALGRDFYLRISLELPLKRLLVGGFEKVFEIGRIFRNEGISTEHLQDYTQMEFYWAYSDMKKLMAFLQKMYQAVILKTFGTLKLTSSGQEINWSGKWPVVEFYDLLEKYAGLTKNSTRSQVEEVLKRNNLEIDVSHPGRELDLIYKKLIRPHLIQPQFMIRPPVEMEPLAKRDPKNPKLVQRLQILAAGTELGKGFSELNDPLDQHRRFMEQMKYREAGDKEAQMLDEDFVEALEYGMPPAAGFGVSERLFAVLADKPIREIVLFPPMKEEKND